MKRKLTVVKVGGEIVENLEALMLFLGKFLKIESDFLILVHGGGRDADEMQRKLGIPIQKFEGKRITDAETLEVIVMCYSAINKKIVAKLQALNTLPIGLCGADFDLIRCKKREVKEIDYGFVGDVQYVSGNKLKSFIEAGIIPVLSPVTHDGQGQLLNTNADTVASEIAKSLSDDYDVELTYCFGKKGVLSDENNDDSVIPVITNVMFDRLRKEGVINKGMIPKLENAFSAINAGVTQVLITHADQIADKKAGTIIVM